MAALSGVVHGADGNPASKLVRVYRRDTGTFVGAVLSDGTTGAWSITTADTAEHFAVAHDGTTTSFSLTDDFDSLSADWVITQAGGSGASATVSGGYLLASSYGTGSGVWHGFTATRTITSIAAFDITFDQIVCPSVSGALGQIIIQIGTISWAFSDAFSSDATLPTASLVVGGSTKYSESLASFSGAIRFVLAGSTLTFYSNGVEKWSGTYSGGAVSAIDITMQQFSTFTSIPFKVGKVLSTPVPVLSASGSENVLVFDRVVPV